MKIQCGQCERKYKVPDEKVGGKAFKVRCRNCESTIIVRPDGRVSTRPPAGAEPAMASSPAPAQEASGGYSGADEQAVWHVVVDGDQQGPYAPVVLSEMLTVGTIDWDAYVWREGFDGWLPARDVPELVEAITGQPYDPSYASDGDAEDDGAAPVGGVFGATTGDASLDADVDSAMDNVFGGAFGGDAETEESPFSPSAEHDVSGLGRSLSDAPAGGSGDFMDFGGVSAPPAARRSSVPASASAADEGPALFGMQGAPAGGAAGGAAAGGASAEADAGGSMTGQRNENSVLFSLSNLQALAGQEGAQSAPASQAGHASGDASGLIDIRALASATGVAASGGGGAASGSSKDDVDDLMSIGTGSSLGANLAAPVLSAADDESDNKKWIIMAAALAGAIVLAAVILAVALGGDDDEVAMAPQPIPGATTATTPTQPAEAQPSTAAKPAAESEETEETLDEGTEEEEEEVDEGDDESGSSSRRRSRSRRTSRSASSSSASSAPAPAPKQKRSRDSIDDLLDNATGGGGKSSSSGGGSSANLPNAPTKSQVVSAMNGVSGKVRACGQGKTGIAMVSVSVSGSTGRVKSANVSGNFAGTPTGSCIARAVRAAKFPKFKQSTFTVKYPFRI